MTFDPKKLKELLAERGITNRDLADRLAMNRRQVSRWISGENPPTEKNKQKIAEVLGCDAAVFDPSFSNEGDVPVYAKVSTASHNAFTVMQKRFGISQKDLVELAPVLFAVVADLALKVPDVDLERASQGYVPYWTSADMQDGFNLCDVPAAKNRKCFGISPERPDRQVARNLFFTALERLCTSAQNVRVMPTVEPGVTPTAKGFNPDVDYLHELAGHDPHLIDAVTKGRVRLTRVLDAAEQSGKPVRDILHREVQTVRGQNLRKLEAWRSVYAEQFPAESREYEDIVAAHCHPEGWCPEHYSAAYRAECWADPFLEDRHLNEKTLSVYQQAQTSHQAKNSTGIDLVFPWTDPIYQRFEALKRHRNASKRKFQEAGA